MCGIVGYTGTQNAAPVLLEGLKKLEYRGYDSAGIPKVNTLFSAAVEIVPMQILAYHVARENGCDIDKPKNLAKSVTVE